MEVVFREKLYKAQREESDKLAENRAKALLFPNPDVIVKGFPRAKDFAQCLKDMCSIEEKLEQRRKEVAMRTDFNIPDSYRMFTQGKIGTPGVDCDDLYQTCANVLDSQITKDEMFIIFYRVDKDCDGYWCFDEFK